MAARTRELSLYAASAAAFSATKVVPSTSIRCSTTASLRARATLALRMPARLANRIAQLFRVEPFTGRVRDDICCFVKGGSNTDIADLGNPAGDICLAGLILFRRQSEMCTGRPGRLEPPRIVDRCDICERHENANSRGRHQQSRSLIIACQRHQPLLEPGQLLAKTDPRY